MLSELGEAGQEVVDTPMIRWALILLVLYLAYRVARRFLVADAPRGRTGGSRSASTTSW